MIKQEALEKLKNHVRVADWLDEDYVYRVSKEVLKVAIEALEESMFKQDRACGYQPTKGSSKPPAPPTSGSNAIKPN